MFKKLSFAVVATLILALPASVSAYSDISASDPDFEEIEFVEELGIFPGSNFNPSETLTKGEFARAIVMAKGVDISGVEVLQPYNDVPVSLAPYVELLRRANAVNYPIISKKFETDSNVALWQAVKIGMVYNGLPIANVFDVSEFKNNVGNLSENAVFAPVISAAAKADLVDGNVSPFRPLTRRKFAVLATNLEIVAQKFNEATGSLPGVIRVTDSGPKSNVLTPEQVEIFEDVFGRVLNDYVDKSEIEQEDLFYGSLEGLVGKLNDPFSVFQEPEVLEAFQDSLSNQVEGIGASIAIENGNLVIVSPLVGSPAEQAGLLPGDIIQKINGDDAGNLTLTKAVSKIKGRAGTKVTLTIVRGSSVFDVTITRAEISIPSVTVEVTSNDVAIIKVNNFGIGASSSFNRAVDQLNLSAVDGIVLDLRNNPGGFLDSAISMADNFLDKGDVVVQVQDAEGDTEEFFASKSPAFSGIKTAVLINEGTASAAEILAVALKEHRVATLVGQTTYGKGTVQELVTYNDNSALKLTIAKWLTPFGAVIDKTGVTPDEFVTLSASDRSVGNDPQLNRALQLVGG